MSGFLDRVRFGRDHRWAHGHMSDYLDGELASTRHRRMERHVTECPECRQLLAMLRRIVGALHRLPPPVGADALQIAASVRLRLGELPPL
jgi:anti-sigma factor RsiW